MKSGSEDDLHTIADEVFKNLVQNFFKNSQIQISDEKIHSIISEIFSETMSKSVVFEALGTIYAFGKGALLKIFPPIAIGLEVAERATEMVGFNSGKFMKNIMGLDTNKAINAIVASLTLTARNKIENLSEQNIFVPLRNELHDK